jgi:CheY-like chemotaxis protein
VEASEAKSRFLASMSHELRTPLNAIIGYSEMLIEEAGDRGAGNLVDDLEKVAGSGRHLLGLINDVLDLSKIEAGKMEVHVEEFDVAEMLRDVQATISPLVQRNGNLLEMRLGGPLGAMRSDQMKIRQNLLNLLSNAAKFTENGRITLDVQRTAREGSDWLVFELSDTGIGMTEEQAGRLFAAFTQADSSTTRLYGGTGLGLSITRSFSRAVGGDITLRSSPGEGSTFTMSLPAEIERVGGEAVEAPVDGEYVLIIDDEAAARRTMADALTQVGYASREAAGGPEGIAVARVSRPLAIVLDVLMPHQDGWSVLRELKADAELSDIPVILATVLADRELGMALGAVEYLVKPIDSGALIATLKTLGAERGDVLVIDDDEASRGFLRRVLVRQGMGVREAGDGERGLDEMRRARPDLVLLDIIMPRLDGFAVLREMQAAPDLCDIPVIVVTSKDLDAGERATLREGAAAVVTKGGETRGALVEALRRQVGQAAAQERGT